MQSTECATWDGTVPATSSRRGLQTSARSIRVRSSAALGAEGRTVPAQGAPTGRCPCQRPDPHLTAPQCLRFPGPPSVGEGRARVCPTVARLGTSCHRSRASHEETRPRCAWSSGPRSCPSSCVQSSADSNDPAHEAVPAAVRQSRRRCGQRPSSWFCAPSRCWRWPTPLPLHGAASPGWLSPANFPVHVTTGGATKLVQMPNSLHMTEGVSRAVPGCGGSDNLPFVGGSRIRARVYSKNAILGVA